MKLIQLGGRLERPANEVLRLEASINYTMIYFKNGEKTLVATTMGKIQKRLPEKDFFRINRGEVINLNEVEIAPDGSYVLTKNGFQLFTSRRRKEILLALIS